MTNKEWRESHKEYLAKYHKEWQKNNKDKQKAYQEKNRLKITEYQKEWREKNKEYNKTRRAIWYQKNKDKVKKKCHDYLMAHMSEFCARRDKRVNLLKSLGGCHTVAQWREIKAKQNNLCNICHKEKKLTKDHVIPVSKWVEWSKLNNPSYKCNDPQNLQALCSSCNSIKGITIK